MAWCLAKPQGQLYLLPLLFYVFIFRSTFSLALKRVSMVCTYDRYVFVQQINIIMCRSACFSFRSHNITMRKFLSHGIILNTCRQSILDTVCTMHLGKVQQKV